MLAFVEEETRELASSPHPSWAPLPREDTERRRPGKELSSVNHDLGLPQPAELWEINSCGLSHPLGSNLLWQPELTGTAA